MYTSTDHPHLRYDYRSLLASACRSPLLKRTLFALTLLMTLVIATSANAANTEFDHFSTGFPLDGSHQSADCGSCHVRGVFKGTPLRCASCHSGALRMEGQQMPPNHIRTTDSCQDCHTTRDWKQVTRVDHIAVIGSCISCHNGTVATGKSASHVTSGSSCDDCHSTNIWSGAVFDHANVSGNCASCHNGATATGKNAQHIQTNNL